MARPLTTPHRNPSGSRRSRGRGVALAALTLAVAAGHGCVAERVAEALGPASARDVPQRMAISFVREMALVAPPPMAAAVPAPRRATPAVQSVAPAASQPERPAAADEAETTDAEAALPPAEPPGAAAPEAAASGISDASAAVAAPAASAEGADPAVAQAVPGAASAPADAQPFAWPDSTRMSYRLTGNYRGPVDGSAQVEWVHAGERYQLHLDVAIGPSAAPLMSRKMSSQGRLTAQGLAPERYDEETDRLFGQRRHVGLRFEAGSVLLANGERSTGWDAVQDAVSQFVQLTFLMTTQPALMQPGSRIAMPVALPRRVAPWVYEVLDAEVLATPFGPLRTMHLRPRLADRRGGELSAQVWIAPELQYLPVRIRIEQDAETFIDLMIDRLPLIAAAPSTSTAGTAPTHPPGKPSP